MAIQNINTGSGPNSGNGDTLRTAFTKINSNFNYIINTLTNAVNSETDPKFSTSTAASISATDITNWNQAYQSYLTVTNITLTQGNQPNITSIGTLTNLVVDGTITAQALNIDLTSISISTISTDDPIETTSNEAAINTFTGALRVTGGVGIGGDLWAKKLHQTENSVAIGYLAGRINQNDSSVAIGRLAGEYNQDLRSVAIGRAVGQFTQSSYTVAIGDTAGQYAQQSFSVAIGNNAGKYYQHERAIAIGHLSGFRDQGTYTIAIGSFAGFNTQTSYSIILNASGSDLDATTSGFYVSPIRADSSISATNIAVYYNPITKELTTASTAAGTTFNGGTISNPLIITNTTTNTTSDTGALVVAGGVGIGGNLHVQGYGHFGLEPTIAFTNPLAVLTGDADDFTQMSIQNLNSGTSASSDYVATADDGTDELYYINMGINNSNYSDLGWTISGAHDGYLYVSNGNLTVGTTEPATYVKIHIGGTLEGDVVATFRDPGTDSTSSFSGALTVDGGIGITGQMHLQETLHVGNPDLDLPNAVFIGQRYIDSYVQLGVQNSHPGTNASSDFIATADNGDDTSYYIDLGINSSGYNNLDWTVSGPNDGYLYINSGNLTLGTDSTGTNVKIHIGGTLAENVVATFDANTLTLAQHVLPAADLTYDLGSTSSQWRSLYVGTSTIYLGGTALSVSGGTITVDGSPVSGGGNPFNQDLNTTSSVTFNSVGATTINVSQINGTNPGNELVIQANNNNWTFGSDGTTTFPSGGDILFDSSATSRITGVSEVIFADGTTQTTAFTGTSALLDILDTNGIDTNYYLTFVENRAAGQELRADVDLTFNSWSNTLGVGRISVNSTTASTGTTTGALTVAGGIGIGGNITLGGSLDFANGTTQTTAYTGIASSGTTATSAAVGYIGMPQNKQNNTYSVQITDQGKHIYCTGTSFTVTIPANTVTNFPIGSTIAFIAGPNTTATIAIQTDTMYLGGSTGTSGSRTLAPFGMATAVKVEDTIWFISGAGLT